MLTLSFGYKKPETNDIGPIVFPALEGNIQQLNDHTHNGSDSAPLNSGSITPLFATILSGAWAVVAGTGLYKQTITLPAALAYDSTGFDCRLDDGTLVYPTVLKVSASQYDIFLNDNTVGMTVLYI